MQRVDLPQFFDPGRRPHRLPPAWIKAGWRVRNFLRVFVADVTAPVRDNQQQLTALLALLAAYYAVKSKGLAALFEQIGIFSTWWTTLLAAIPIWIGINFIRAAAKTADAEASKGFWIGNKFVYHTPEPIGAVEWRPKDNGSSKPIQLKHPQRDSVAHISLDFYPSTDRIRAGVVWVEQQRLTPQFMHTPSQGGSSGSRVNNGRLWVVAESQAATVPVIIRVYCHYFVIGKGALDD